MNQVSSLELTGRHVLNVILLHFDWKFFAILKELMSVHLEVLGSIILVIGAWYGIFLIYLSMILFLEQIWHIGPIVLRSGHDSFSLV
uniref:Uncharacterized protein n=1 Tax=Arundo donax TaxID=35708 RepID=A0A0A9GJK6_ARUDO